MRTRLWGLRESGHYGEGLHFGNIGDLGLWFVYQTRSVCYGNDYSDQLDSRIQETALFGRRSKDRKNMFIQLLLFK